jgi:hypothetical protein
MLIGTPLALAASAYAVQREGARILPLLALTISGLEWLGMILMNFGV